MEKEKSAQTPTPDSHPVKNNDNLASRAIASAAFATVGAKLSYLGIFKDIDNILGNQKVSFWQKVKWTVNGTLWKKTKQKIHYLREIEQASALASFFQLTKTNNTVMAIGAAIGAVVGWVRGDRIENWKDIIKHPVDSTKIVFGFKEPKKAEDTTLYAKAENNAGVTNPLHTNSTNWQDYTRERKENPQLIARS